MVAANIAIFLRTRREFFGFGVGCGFTRHGKFAAMLAQGLSKTHAFHGAFQAERLRDMML